ncbi:hypothetical protein ACFQVC_08615 [Streptomyces monticola]|uniref:Bacterial Ig-like domain-containing protein n=1 Tax=Streptomyces monticola TaxID=2666263 RepID=A0ABW2JFM6_9ACTN
MSEAPSRNTRSQWGRRPFTEGIDTSGEFPVAYRFSHARNGNRTLFVVFADFSAPGDYGFSNGVLDGLRANVLWIRDRFEGQRSYYLCKDMDFSLAESVHALIAKVVKALDLTYDDCVLWGSSKGGSAALYFGLRHGFRSVVASAPQFAIGTWVDERHPAAARFMMGDAYTERNVRELDAVLPELIAAERHRSTHVYLLSSPQDEQYKVQVKPYLQLFKAYENFNFVCCDSPLVSRHDQVSIRNLPTLMGVAGLLADGIAPRLGVVCTGYERPGGDTKGIDGYLATTSVVRDSVRVPSVRTPGVRGRLRGDAQVRLEGHAPGAVRVSLWRDGAYLASAPVSADGAWSWVSGGPWTPGRHTVRLFAVDAAGHQSRRADAGFTVMDVPAMKPDVPAMKLDVPAMKKEYADV